ncbi:cytochrome P450 [uncultured Jatrophihabitans sp.]|uniref:cytochrome P450 n=1 Tax=uncultured Jatrophihabitans sp. TaxID=1610747 RepID=UPI0035C9516E
MGQLDSQTAHADLRGVDHNAAPFCAPDVAVRAAAWKELRERCPVGRSDQYDGYWILSDHASVAEACRNGEIFSNRYEPDADDGINYIGENGYPRMDWPELAIGEAYGEHHSYLRRVFNPLFSPTAVRRFEPAMRQVASWVLDQRVEDGAMDLMNDFVTPVTAISTLLFLGLPADLWQDTADVYHSIFGMAPDTAEFTHTVEITMPRLMDAFLSAAKAARHDRAEELLGAIARLEYDGELMNDEQLTKVLTNMVGAGVDTTNNTTARGLHQLAADPALRAAVMADRRLIDATCEETLRMYPSAQVMTCTITQDVEFAGQQLRRGEPAVLSLSGANRDPKVFADPDVFHVERTSNRHLAFGRGVHRCLGAHVARQMFRVMVAEILDRVPDYVVDDAKVVEYGGNPYLMGVWSMPVTFTAAPQLGVKRPW